MTTAAIVQARLGSTRLPAKVLLPLPTGRTVLGEVLWRCCQIPGIDTVVCAIPDTAENDILNGSAHQAFAGRIGGYGMPWLVVRGPEHDVLARYAKAAEVVNADVIMRITSDCPLIDPEVCGRILARQKEENVDYCSNCHPRSWPQGYDCEVFKRRALMRAHEEAEAPNDREHVTPYLVRWPGFTRANVADVGGDRSHYRWALDTLSDYVRIWGVMEEQMREAA